MNHPTRLFLAFSLLGLTIGCGNSSKTGEVKDTDGNSYPTVRIGSQTWMADNLRTTKYKDGTDILNVTPDSLWASASQGAFSWFKNDPGNKATYGAYYNWHTVHSGKLCPEGWHVPTDAEWRTLTTYLGGEAGAGFRLKSDSGWQKQGNGNNESGFTALPLGYRSGKGAFVSQGSGSYFWSATENSTNAWYTVLFGKDGSAYKYFGPKQSGFSVRCIQDKP